MYAKSGGTPCSHNAAVGAGPARAAQHLLAGARIVFVFGACRGRTLNLRGSIGHVSTGRALRHLLIGPTPWRLPSTSSEISGGKKRSALGQCSSSSRTTTSLSCATLCMDMCIYTRASMCIDMRIDTCMGAWPMLFRGVVLCLSHNHRHTARGCALSLKGSPGMTGLAGSRLQP